jgi:hypothetical protein
VYALLQSAAISGMRGGVPVAIGKLGTAVGLAAGIAAGPAAIPLLLGAVAVGLGIAKKKIDYHQACIDEIDARAARRGR